mgnify:CR=1 FL=1
MATNFNQILDEIQQQKLQVASLIDDNNATIATCQSELIQLQDQLAGLATLEERTQELQANSNDINLNITVDAAPGVSVASTTPTTAVVTASTTVPGVPTETSPVIGTSRQKRY